MILLKDEVSEPNVKILSELLIEPESTNKPAILNFCALESPPLLKSLLSNVYSSPPSWTITSIVCGASYPNELELIVCVEGDTLVKTVGTAFLDFV